MKHVKTFEGYQLAPKSLKCDDCGYIGKEKEFSRFHVKPRRCPKCKSQNYDYYDIPKPTIPPMPQKIKRDH